MIKYCEFPPAFCEYEAAFEVHLRHGKAIPVCGMHLADVCVTEWDYDPDDITLVRLNRERPKHR